MSAAFLIEATLGLIYVLWAIHSGTRLTIVGDSDLKGPAGAGHEAQGRERSTEQHVDCDAMR